MSEIASAYVRVRPDMSGFRSETERGVKAGFSGITRIVAGLGIGVAVGKALKVGFDELSEGAKVQAQTNAVIKSTGDVSKVSAAEVNNFAQAMLKKSGIDDEATQVAENMLLTFTNIRNEAGKGNDIFTQTSKVVLDMDEAMTHGNTTAESLRNTSILVGKALNDPIKGMGALRRVGVSLDEQQQKTVKSLIAQGRQMDAQKLIIKELNKEFGGSAEAIGNTLPGKLNILRETFRNDMASLIGAAAPALTQIIGFVSDAMPVAFHYLGSTVHFVVDTVRSDIQRVVQITKPYVDLLRTYVSAGIDRLRQVVHDLSSEIGGFDNILEPIKGALQGMGGALAIVVPAILAWTAATKVATAIQAAFNVVLDANPIGAIIVAIAALVGGLVVLYQRNQAFRDFVNAAWADIRAKTVATIEFLRALWAQYGATIIADARAVFTTLSGLVQAGLAGIESFWNQYGGKIKDDARNVFVAIRAVVETTVAVILALWARFGGTIIATTKTALTAVKVVIQQTLIVIRNIVQLVIDLIHGDWGDAWGDLKNIVRAAFTAVVAVLRAQVSIMLSWGKAIGRAILAGLLSILTFIGLQIVGALKGIGDALVAAASSAYKLAIEIGKAIMHGIVDGVKGLGNWAAGEIAGAAKGLVGAFKHPLGIGSPSKVAAKEIGEPIAQGIIVGFLQGINGLTPKMTAAVKGAVGGTSSAVKGMAAGTSSAVAAIVQAAQRYGVDPAAMVAIAMHESGLRAGAVGDQGTSFGLFQLHKGGALGSMSPQAALNALTNALVAAKALAGLGGRGLSGSAAVSLLSRGFERPADPTGEINDAMSHYQEALALVGKAGAGYVKGVTAAVKATLSASTLIRMGPAIIRDPKLGTSLLPDLGAAIGDLAKKAASTKNIGAGAETYLRQEETLLELAYSTLKADLAKAKGPARARIEAAMEVVHRKIGAVIAAAEDAVIVTGDALLPDKLREQLRNLTSRFKAVSDLSAVMTGDTLARYQAALLGNIQDQRNVLMHEVDALKAKLAASRGRQKAAIQAELGKVRGQLSAVNDQIMQALQSAVQAAQGRVSGLLGTIKSKMDAQFEAATQAMLTKLGQQFFQGSLTPQEAALQAYQTTKSQAALQDALIAAQSDLAQSIANGETDPATLAQKRAALTAAQDAIKADQLQTAATQSRTKADQAYAAAAAKLQADRQALEEQMNEQIDKLTDAILNGTGSIKDLDAIAKQYGVSITTAAIPEMADLAGATRSLAAEFRRLEAWIRKTTGSSGAVAGPSSSITQATAFGNVLNAAFQNALKGLNVPGLASGGWVKARPGGTIVNLAEGGEDELVAPASRVAAAQSRGIRDIVGALAPLGTLEAMHRAILEVLNELRRQTDFLAAPEAATAASNLGNLSAVQARR